MAKVPDRQVRNWFSKFYSLIDEPGSSSDLDAFRKLVECIPHKSSWELPLDLSPSQSTIFCYLKKIGKVSKLGVWFLHTLCEMNKENCTSIATSLIWKQRNDSFLKNIITDNEKFRIWRNVWGSARAWDWKQSIRKEKGKEKGRRLYTCLCCVCLELCLTSWQSEEWENDRVSCRKCRVYISNHVTRPAPNTSFILCVTKSKAHDFSDQ